MASQPPPSKPRKRITPVLIAAAKPSTTATATATTAAEVATGVSEGIEAAAVLEAGAAPAGPVKEEAKEQRGRGQAKDREEKADTEGKTGLGKREKKHAPLTAHNVMYAGLLSSDSEDLDYSDAEEESDEDQGEDELEEIEEEDLSEDLLESDEESIEGCSSEEEEDDDEADESKEEDVQATAHEEDKGREECEVDLEEEEEDLTDYSGDEEDPEPIPIDAAELLDDSKMQVIYNLVKERNNRQRAKRKNHMEELFQSYLTQCHEMSMPPISEEEFQSLQTVIQQKLLSEKGQSATNQIAGERKEQEERAGEETVVKEGEGEEVILHPYMDDDAFINDGDPNEEWKPMPKNKVRNKKRTRRGKKEDGGSSSSSGSLMGTRLLIPGIGMKNAGLYKGFRESFTSTVGKFVEQILKHNDLQSLLCGIIRAGLFIYPYEEKMPAVGTAEGDPARLALANNTIIENFRKGASPSTLLATLSRWERDIYRHANDKNSNEEKKEDETEAKEGKEAANRNERPCSPQDWYEKRPVGKELAPWMESLLPILAALDAEELLHFYSIPAVMSIHQVLEEVDEAEAKVKAEKEDKKRKEQEQQRQEEEKERKETATRQQTQQVQESDSAASTAGIVKKKRLAKRKNKSTMKAKPASKTPTQSATTSTPMTTTTERDEEQENVDSTKKESFVETAERTVAGTVSQQSVKPTVRRLARRTKKISTAISTSKATKANVETSDASPSSSLSSSLATIDNEEIEKNEENETETAQASEAQQATAVCIGTELKDEELGDELTVVLSTTQKLTAKVIALLRDINRACEEKVEADRLASEKEKEKQLKRASSSSKRRRSKDQQQAEGEDAGRDSPHDEKKDEAQQKTKKGEKKTTKKKQNKTGETSSPLLSKQKRRQPLMKVYDEDDRENCGPNQSNINAGQSNNNTNENLKQHKKLVVVPKKKTAASNHPKKNGVVMQKMEEDEEKALNIGDSTPPGGSKRPSAAASDKESNKLLLRQRVLELEKQLEETKRALSAL